MYWSDRTVFDGTGIYSIYYTRYYMFRRLTMAIFRLKYLVSSYKRLLWAVYSGEVGGDIVSTSPPTSPLYTAHNKSRITCLVSISCTT